MKLPSGAQALTYSDRFNKSYKINLKSIRMFAFAVVWVSVSLPCGAMGWPVVCAYGISCSNSLFFLNVKLNKCKHKTGFMVYI